MKNKHLCLMSCLIGLFSTLLPLQSLCAQEALEIARLDSAEGTVLVRRKGETSFTNLEVGSILWAQDIIRTDKNTRASIVFSSGTLLRLAPGSTLQFQDQDPSNPKVRKMQMDEGKAHFFDREPAEFPQIASPAVTTAVRGTEFVISVQAKQTQVSVISGLVACTNSFGSEEAKGGEQISTELGKAPTKAILVDPAELVQWTLYYPNLQLPKDFDSNSLKDSFLQVQSFLRAGQVVEAKAALDNLEPSISSIQDEEDRREAQSMLFATRSIIASAQSDNQQAINLASKSWDLNSSTAAAMASALAYQSDGQLDQAQHWLNLANSKEPTNSQVLSRQAEIALSFGETDQARQLASLALQSDPNDAFALSVLGFAHLMQDERTKAINLFNQAIQRASSLGLPRLGLGLAFIRKGDLEAGRKEIEKAAALEPLTAIYRSYLGKVYFEQDREELALGEYEQAISLDDRDPTPYLYRAYSFLSANKPIEALNDVEKSIELNNNRAVYRSSLLLDQDLGVRSAGLAEVFTTLGFSQAARVEAIKSINRDYTNYSAHRMLGDSYNSIFLNDAQISETKLATLLAPLSFNLFSQGSAASSLNEYNSLFDRDQNRIEVSGEYQTQDNLLLPEIQAAGKQEKWGYLLAYQGLFTDEPGVGNDSRRQRGRLALQYQPQYDDLFVFDHNSTYRAAYNDAQTPEDVNFEEYEFDLGYRHTFAPASTLIVSSTLSDQRNNFLNRSLEREIDLTQKFEGEMANFTDLLLIDDFSRENVESARNTIQWIYDSRLFSFVNGVQIYTANAKRKEMSPVLEDQEEIFNDLDYSLESFGYNRLSSTDIYSYSTWHLSSWADLSAGGSWSEIELEDREITPFADGTSEKNHLSPKLGLSLYPTSDLVLRTAYFEGLRKSSLEDRASLEPTLVGGLNQRFTDSSGSFGRTLGLGADYKFAASTYLGVEGLKRHVIDNLGSAISTVELDYDTGIATNGVNVDPAQDIHQDQDIIRAYVYHVISEQLVGTINHEWASFERTDPDIAQDLDLEKTSLGLRYFDPSGWYLLSDLTRRYQRRNGSDFGENGSNDFWLLDAGLGYRIPARKGAVELRFNNIFDEEFEYDQSLGLEEFVRDDFNVILAFTFRN